MRSVYVFLCAAAAWYAAGSFTRQPPREAAANAAAAGLVCAALSLLLPLAGIRGDWSLAAFVLLAPIVPLQGARSREDRLAALLTAVGTYGLLAFLCRAAGRFLAPGWALLLACLPAAAVLGAVLAISPYVPPEDWPEYFDGKGQEHMTVRRTGVWLTLGGMAALETAVFLLPEAPATPLQAAVLGGLCAALWWGALYGVCLMTAYRRERLTTLIDQDYRSEMQAFMSVIRSQRHDYNFHVQALSGLINEGNIEDCRAYLNNLVRDSADMNTILPIRDPAIAALVYSFRTMAREDGIELHLDIQNDLSCVATSVYETNKVIGNLLQNAIDEVRTHEDKSFGIYLYILKRGENCIIHVANKLAPAADAESCLRDMYKPGCTTKASHEGIGLSSVQHLLSRYRGVVYSRLEGDIIHFVAKIPLHLEGGLP